MRLFIAAVLCVFTGTNLYAQQSNSNNTPSATQGYSNNIYEIKRQFQYQVLHNPADKENDEDNELTRFNRWFHDMEPRCYPTGDMPRPDVLLKAMQHSTKTAGKGSKKTTETAWQPVGPKTVPSNFNGIGRVNVIVIDPKDTGTLYIGSACGGVYISHDGGATWTSNTDNFPSLSIADIAVNPKHTDTIYAATGDGYGYENGGTYTIFWGGLYSAGVMKSTDGGKTWDTTGLSYLQTNNNIIQKLLINPDNPNILLAATRKGIWRTKDAGATWDSVDGGHVFSMAFQPNEPNTIYAVNNTDLRVSYDGGLTWKTLNGGINPTGDRCSIAVTAKAPNTIYLLDSKENLYCSRNGGGTFFATISPDAIAKFYGYYDRVLAVSPADSNYVLAYGMIMAKSTNGGFAWNKTDPGGSVHVDNHAVAINPLHPNTIYTGDDGGISVSYDGGTHWTNLANGLMISQIYKMSSSQQNPNILLCGLQDNGSFSYNGTNWLGVTGGDGEACAISPIDDQFQISSSQYGNFNMSFNQGITFEHLDITTEKGAWTAPVVFDPNDEQTIYFGYEHIYVTNDGAGSFTKLPAAIFTDGVISLAIGHSDSKVLYAATYGNIQVSKDAGATWKSVRGNLPSDIAITNIAVDYNDPMRVYVTMSGYKDGSKVFLSTTGGTTWTNISGNLPNLPANCIAVDSSTPGALFVGTDMGVYYTDASQTGWTLYSTGLPNVIVNDIHINYYDYNVRAATYGRGIWVNRLKKDAPPHNVGISTVSRSASPGISVYPNPTENNWRILFQKQKPSDFSVRVTDAAGRTVYTLQNVDVIDASKLAAGMYHIEVAAGAEHYSTKAIRR